MGRKSDLKPVVAEIAERSIHRLKHLGEPQAEKVKPHPSHAIVKMLRARERGSLKAGTRMEMVRTQKEIEIPSFHQK